MPKRRSLVLFRYADPADPSKGIAGLGSRRDFEACINRFNTAGDGSPPGSTVRYFGPGIVIEIAASEGEVRQALVSCNEPDIAWPVLRGICKAGGWTMQDVDSGQVFG